MKYFYAISPGVTVHTGSLRDGSFSCGIPGSKLPGYYHSVPTGQKPPDTVHQINAAPTIEHASTIWCGRRQVTLWSGH
jgi:hypothetical protein